MDLKFTVRNSGFDLQTINMSSKFQSIYLADCKQCWNITSNVRSVYTVLLRILHIHFLCNTMRLGKWAKKIQNNFSNKQNNTFNQNVSFILWDWSSKIRSAKVFNKYNSTFDEIERYWHSYTLLQTYRLCVSLQKKTEKPVLFYQVELFKISCILLYYIVITLQIL